MNPVNLLFAKAGVLTKRGRVSYWDTHTYGIRSSNHRGRPEAGLWFRTRGCRCDRAGGCVMCDYGAGPDNTSSEEMIKFVKQGLDTLPDYLYHLLVSPLGSFLDEWEVPKTARGEILHLMGETRYETFAFESRAETISDVAIAQCRSYLGDRGLKVYMGLESANAWISKYCINKALSLDIFEQAIQVLNRNSVSAIANVLLGSPFLSPLETIEDVIESVMWAFSRGVTECNLFPTHVKRWALLQWLYEKGLYSPPSLWSYVELIRRIGPEIVCQKIELSWYKPYGSTNVVLSPTTCNLCANKVIDYLDWFDETNDYSWIEKLIAFECRCKDIWRAEMEVSPTISVLDRAIAAYELIGRELLGEAWWQRYGEKVLLEMQVDAAPFPKFTSLASQDYPY